MLFIEKIGKCDLGQHKDFILAIVFLIMKEHSKIKIVGKTEKRIRSYIEDNVKVLPEKIKEVLEENKIVNKLGFNEKIEGIGRSLMLHLEGIYVDDLVFDEIENLEKTEILGKKSRKIVKSDKLGETFDNYDF